MLVISIPGHLGTGQLVWQLDSPKRLPTGEAGATRATGTYNCSQPDIYIYIYIYI